MQKKPNVKAGKRIFLGTKAQVPLMEGGARGSLFLSKDGKALMSRDNLSHSLGPYCSESYVAGMWFPERGGISRAFTLHCVQ